VKLISCLICIRDAELKSQLWTLPDDNSSIAIQFQWRANLLKSHLCLYTGMTEARTNWYAVIEKSHCNHCLPMWSNTQWIRSIETTLCELPVFRPKACQFVWASDATIDVHDWKQSPEIEPTKRVLMCRGWSLVPSLTEELGKLKNLSSPMPIPTEIYHKSDLVYLPLSEISPMTLERWQIDCPCWATPMCGIRDVTLIEDSI
jgi:hypothetical protein